MEQVNFTFLPRRGCWLHHQQVRCTSCIYSRVVSSGPGYVCVSFRHQHHLPVGVYGVVGGKLSLSRGRTGQGKMAREKGELEEE